MNAEGMNAVRIMTMHASKGLQFPMVFLPGMDESLAPRTQALVMHESEEGLTLAYEEDSAKRRKMDAFRLQLGKETEEQKRLFYVAVTRAMDFLCMSGAPHPKKGPTGRLGYLDEAFGLFSHPEEASPPFDIISEIEAQPSRDTHTKPEAQRRQDSVLTHTGPLSYTPLLVRMNVTEDTEMLAKDHGRDWTVTGTVLHEVLEEMSYGSLEPNEARTRARSLIARQQLTQSTDEILERVCEGVKNLERSGLLSKIVMPQGPGAYTELPFEYQDGNILYSGRIDRLIIKGDTAHVYDYKSFPVPPDEEREVLGQYSTQMKRYALAAGELFGKKVKAYLVLTHEGKLLEVPL